jgi:purine-binding chemotaxis protein CheW
MATYDDDDLSDDPDNLEQMFLTFRVDGLEYAVPVAVVTEIVRLPKSFPIPDVPSYVRGVINLRGKVIPLLDVRGRFGLADAPYTDRTVVVVLDLGEVSTGLVVDAVNEVTEILPANVESLGAGRDERSALVRGIAKRAAGVSMILDVDALVGIAARTGADTANSLQS